MLDEVAFLSDSPKAALAAATLLAVQAKRRSLDVTDVAARHHHVFLGYKVFGCKVDRLGYNLCPTLVGVCVLDIHQFVNKSDPKASCRRQESLRVLRSMLLFP